MVPFRFAVHIYNDQIFIVKQKSVDYSAVVALPT